MDGPFLRSGQLTDHTHSYSQGKRYPTHTDEMVGFNKRIPHSSYLNSDFYDKRLLTNLDSMYGHIRKKHDDEIAKPLTRYTTEQKPRLTSFIDSIKDLPESDSPNMRRLGFVLILIGLAFIPLTGGTSLVTLIPGLVALIPTSVGIGVGSGIFGVGVTLFTPEFFTSGTHHNVRKKNGYEPSVIDLRTDQKSQNSSHTSSDYDDDGNESVDGQSRSSSPDQTICEEQVIEEDVFLNQIHDSYIIFPKQKPPPESDGGF